MQRATTLLIDRGDLPSLAACSLQSEAEPFVLWHPIEPDAAAPPREIAVREHAEIWRVGPPLIGRFGPLGVPGMAPPTELFQAQLLLQAMTAAIQIGCARMVWPIQAGPDPHAVVATIERAHRIASLARIGEARGLDLDLPLVDLTDLQVLEIADDAGAPLGACWPCEESVPTPCGACTGCGRWRRAFRQLHLPWPWPVASASNRRPVTSCSPELIDNPG